MYNDYEVGHGKPPTETQFKKGKSGNPKGRPKGSENVGTAFRKALNASMEVTVGGKTKKMTLKEVLVQRLVNSAVTGKVSDQIRLLAAIDKYAPDLLVNDTRPSEIEVSFVYPKVPTKDPQYEKYLAEKENKAKEAVATTDPLDC